MFTQDPAMIEQLNAQHKRPVYLVRIDFPDGVLAMNTHLIELPFEGDVYRPVGGAGKIGSVKEDGYIKPHQLSLTLSALDPAILSVALTSDYVGSDVKVYFGVLDEHYHLIAASLRFSGRITSMPMKYGKRNTVEVRVSSRFEDWDRIRNARYTDADQQAKFPGDKFCEFAPQMVEKSINWGVPYSTQSSSGHGGRNGSITRKQR
jgi:hypothetical protein